MSINPTEFLAAEYLAAHSRLQRIEDRLLLIAAGGGLLSAGAAAYTLNFRATLNLKPGYAWALPLPFLVTAAVLLALVGWRMGARAQLAALRRQAGLPEPGPSRALPMLHRLLWLPGAGLAGLFGLTFLFSLRAIYTASRVAGTSFGLIYTLLCACLALAGWAMWREWRGQPALTSGELQRLALPYPAELIKGFGLVAAGFVVPWLTNGLNASQLTAVNALFRRDIDFSTSLPLAAIFALGLVYFLIIEGLLVPAGRMWRAHRAHAAESLGYAQIWARVGLALLLAALVGGVPLLILAGLITLQQAVAGLAAGPISEAGSTWALRGAAESISHQGAQARFDLLWSGLLAPLRFYTGALVWFGFSWSFTILLLLFCVLTFLSVGLRAAQRAREARILTVRGEEPLAYDLHDAPRWQYAGFLAAGLTAAGLLALQILVEDCTFSNPFLITVYGHCKTAGMHYSYLGLLNSLLLTFDLLLIGLFACAGAVRLLGRGRPGLLVAATRARTRVMPALIVIAAGLALAACITGQVSLGLGGLLVGVGVCALWNER